MSRIRNIPSSDFKDIDPEEIIKQIDTPEDGVSATLQLTRTEKHGSRADHHVPTAPDPDFLKRYQLDKGGVDNMTPKRFQIPSEDSEFDTPLSMISPLPMSPKLQDDQFQASPIPDGNNSFIDNPFSQNNPENNGNDNNVQSNADDSDRRNSEPVTATIEETAGNNANIFGEQLEFPTPQIAEQQKIEEGDVQKRGSETPGNNELLFENEKQGLKLFCESEEKKEFLEEILKKKGINRHDDFNYIWKGQKESSSDYQAPLPPKIPMFALESFFDVKSKKEPNQESINFVDFDENQIREWTSASGPSDPLLLLLFRQFQKRTANYFSKQLQSFKEFKKTQNLQSFERNSEEKAYKSFLGIRNELFYLNFLQNMKILVEQSFLSNNQNEKSTAHPAESKIPSKMKYFFDLFQIEPFRNRTQNHSHDVLGFLIELCNSWFPNAENTEKGKYFDPKEIKNLKELYFPKAKSLLGSNPEKKKSFLEPNDKIIKKQRKPLISLEKEKDSSSSTAKPIDRNVQLKDPELIQNSISKMLKIENFPKGPHRDMMEGVVESIKKEILNYAEAEEKFVGKLPLTDEEKMKKIQERIAKFMEDPLYQKKEEEIEKIKSYFFPDQKQSNKQAEDQNKPNAASEAPESKPEPSDKQQPAKKTRKSPTAFKSFLENDIMLENNQQIETEEQFLLLEYFTNIVVGDILSSVLKYVSPKHLETYSEQLLAQSLPMVVGRTDYVFQWWFFEIVDLYCYVVRRLSVHNEIGLKIIFDIMKEAFPNTESLKNKPEAIFFIRALKYIKIEMVESAQKIDVLKNLFEYLLGLVDTFKKEALVRNDLVAIFDNMYVQMDFQFPVAQMFKKETESLMQKAEKWTTKKFPSKQRALLFQALLIAHFSSASMPKKEIVDPKKKPSSSSGKKTNGEEAQSFKLKGDAFLKKILKEFKTLPPNTNAYKKGKFLATGLTGCDNSAEINPFREEARLKKQISGLKKQYFPTQSTEKSQDTTTDKEDPIIESAESGSLATTMSNLEKANVAASEENDDDDGNSMEDTESDTLTNNTLANVNYIQCIVRLLENKFGIDKNSDISGKKRYTSFFRTRGLYSNKELFTNIDGNDPIVTLRLNYEEITFDDFDENAKYGFVEAEIDEKAESFKKKKEYMDLLKEMVEKIVEELFGGQFSLDGPALAKGKEYYFPPLIFSNENSLSQAVDSYVNLIIRIATISLDIVFKQILPFLFHIVEKPQTFQNYGTLVLVVLRVLKCFGWVAMKQDEEQEESDKLFFGDIHLESDLKYLQNYQKDNIISSFHEFVAHERTQKQFMKLLDLLSEQFDSTGFNFLVPTTDPAAEQAKKKEEQKQNAFLFNLLSKEYSIPSFTPALDCFNIKKKQSFQSSLSFSVDQDYLFYKSFLTNNFGIFKERINVKEQEFKTLLVNHLSQNGGDFAQSSIQKSMILSAAPAKDKTGKPFQNNANDAVSQIFHKPALYSQSYLLFNDHHTSSSFALQGPAIQRLVSQASSFEKPKSQVVEPSRDLNEMEKEKKRKILGLDRFIVPGGMRTMSIFSASNAGNDVKSEGVVSEIMYQQNPKLTFMDFIFHLNNSNFKLNCSEDLEDLLSEVEIPEERKREVVPLRMFFKEVMVLLPIFLKTNDNMIEEMFGKKELEIMKSRIESNSGSDDENHDISLKESWAFSQKFLKYLLIEDTFIAKQASSSLQCMFFQNDMLRLPIIKELIEMISHILSKKPELPEKLEERFKEEDKFIIPSIKVIMKQILVLLDLWKCVLSTNNKEKDDFSESAKKVTADLMKTLECIAVCCACFFDRKIRLLSFRLIKCIHELSQVFGSKLGFGLEPILAKPKILQNAIKKLLKPLILQEKDLEKKRQFELWLDPTFLKYLSEQFSFEYLSQINSFDVLFNLYLTEFVREVLDASDPTTAVEFQSMLHDLILPSFKNKVSWFYSFSSFFESLVVDSAQNPSSKGVTGKLEIIFDMFHGKLEDKTKEDLIGLQALCGVFSSLVITKNNAMDHFSTKILKKWSQLMFNYIEKTKEPLQIEKKKGKNIPVLLPSKSFLQTVFSQQNLISNMEQITSFLFKCTPKKNPFSNFVQSIVLDLSAVLVLPFIHEMKSFIFREYPQIEREEPKLADKKSKVSKAKPAEKKCPQDDEIEVLIRNMNSIFHFLNNIILSDEFKKSFEVCEQTQDKEKIDSFFMDCSQLVSRVLPYITSIETDYINSKFKSNEANQAIVKKNLSQKKIKKTLNIKTLIKDIFSPMKLYLLQKQMESNFVLFLKNFAQYAFHHFKVRNSEDMSIKQPEEGGISFFHLPAMETQDFFWSEEERIQIIEYLQHFTKKNPKLVDPIPEYDSDPLQQLSVSDSEIPVSIDEQTIISMIWGESKQIFELIAPAAIKNFKPKDPRQQPWLSSLQKKVFETEVILTQRIKDMGQQTALESQETVKRILWLNPLHTVFGRAGQAFNKISAIAASLFLGGEGVTDQEGSIKTFEKGKNGMTNLMQWFETAPLRGCNDMLSPILVYHYRWLFSNFFEQFYLQSNELILSQYISAFHHLLVCGTVKFKQNPHKFRDFLFEEKEDLSFQTFLLHDPKLFSSFIVALMFCVQHPFVSIHAPALDLLIVLSKFQILSEFGMKNSDNPTKENILTRKLLEEKLNILEKMSEGFKTASLPNLEQYFSQISVFLKEIFYTFTLGIISECCNVSLYWLSPSIFHYFNKNSQLSDFQINLLNYAHMKKRLLKIVEVFSSNVQLSAVVNYNEFLEQLFSFCEDYLSNFYEFPLEAKQIFCNLLEKSKDESSLDSNLALIVQFIKVVLSKLSDSKKQMRPIMMKVCREIVICCFEYFPFKTMELVLKDMMENVNTYIEYYHFSQKPSNPNPTPNGNNLNTVEISNSSSDSIWEGTNPFILKKQEDFDLLSLLEMFLIDISSTLTFPPMHKNNEILHYLPLLVPTILINLRAGIPLKENRLQKLLLNLLLKCCSFSKVQFESNTVSSMDENLFGKEIVELIRVLKTTPLDIDWNEKEEASGNEIEGQINYQKIISIIFFKFFPIIFQDPHLLHEMYSRTCKQIIDTVAALEIVNETSSKILLKYFSLFKTLLNLMNNEFLVEILTNDVIFRFLLCIEKVSCYYFKKKGFLKIQQTRSGTNPAQIPIVIDNPAAAQKKKKSNKYDAPVPKMMNDEFRQKSLQSYINSGNQTAYIPKFPELGPNIASSHLFSVSEKENHKIFNKFFELLNFFTDLVFRNNLSQNLLFGIEEILKTLLRFFLQTQFLQEDHSLFVLVCESLLNILNTDFLFEHFIGEKRICSILDEIVAELGPLVCPHKNLFCAILNGVVLCSPTVLADDHYQFKDLKKKWFLMITKLYVKQKQVLFAPFLHGKEEKEKESQIDMNDYMKFIIISILTIYSSVLEIETKTDPDDKKAFTKNWLQEIDNLKIFSAFFSNSNLLLDQNSIKQQNNESQEEEEDKFDLISKKNREKGFESLLLNALNEFFRVQNQYPNSMDTCQFFGNTNDFLVELLLSITEEKLEISQNAPLGFFFQFSHIFSSSGIMKKFSQIDSETETRYYDLQYTVLLVFQFLINFFCQKLEENNENLQKKQEKWNMILSLIGFTPIIKLIAQIMDEDLIPNLDLLTSQISHNLVLKERILRNLNLTNLILNSYIQFGVFLNEIPLSNEETTNLSKLRDAKMFGSFEIKKSLINSMKNFEKNTIIIPWVETLTKSIEKKTKDFLKASNNPKFFLDNVLMNCPVDNEIIALLAIHSSKQQKKVQENMLLFNNNNNNNAAMIQNDKKNQSDNISDENSYLRPQDFMKKEFKRSEQQISDSEPHIDLQLDQKQQNDQSSSQQNQQNIVINKSEPNSPSIAQQDQNLNLNLNEIPIEETSPSSMLPVNNGNLMQLPISKQQFNVSVSEDDEEETEDEDDEDDEEEETDESLSNYVLRSTTGQNQSSNQNQSNSSNSKVSAPSNSNQNLQKVPTLAEILSDCSKSQYFEAFVLYLQQEDHSNDPDFSILLENEGSDSNMNVEVDIEMLEFYLQVQEFLDSVGFSNSSGTVSLHSRRDQVLMARSIIDRFVKTSSPDCISSISETTRNKVLALYETQMLKPNATLFDPAFQFVKEKLEKEVYPIFIKSVFYRDMMNQVQ